MSDKAKTPTSSTPAPAVVILAAGKGTRMHSDLPKVLHPVAGRVMLCHVLDTVAQLAPARVTVVVAPGMEAVQDAARAAYGDCRFAVQEGKLGTGAAVLAARAELEASGDAPVLILFGDTPLITAATMRQMLDVLESPTEPALVVLGMRPADPAEYGRLVLGARHELEEIVEFRDASPVQREITLCNSGVMLVRGTHLLPLLDRVENNNAKGEYYLTDIVAIARAQGLSCAVAEARPDEVMGVNSREQLAEAEAVLQQRLRRQAMAQGATLIAPETVFFHYDTRLGKDVTVHPNVVFGKGVVVEEGAEIRAFSHLEGAKVGRGSVVGPFARLRPGAELGAHVHVGNFVEIKNTKMGEGAKASHLTYLGDAVVGGHANIGAGTITCNYDGFDKHTTHIGARAFIGSNSALVAPVSVGEGAIIGAGSVIVENVEAESLAFTRSEQKAKKGWAANFRLSKMQKKVN